MYGEVVFVHWSVWSNNEDYVSIGNKTRYMMVLDAISDNIIPAEFTDDYE